MDFRLPDLGEGIDSATVTAVLVRPGDAVAAGQAVLSVETDKASMEVEATDAGTVEAVLVKPGDKVPVGGPVPPIPRNQTPPPPAASRRSSSRASARGSTRPLSRPCW